METIRFGIIGLGFFGEHHAEVLADMPGVALSAVCTRRPDRLVEVAERFQVAKRHTDYRNLLQDRDIDCGHAGLAIHGAAGVSLPDTGYWPQWSGRQVGALRNEFEYFVACLRSGRPPERITPAESRAAGQAICAAEDSAATGRVNQPQKESLQENSL